MFYVVTSYGQFLIQDQNRGLKLMASTGYISASALCDIVFRKPVISYLLMQTIVVAGSASGLESSRPLLQI